MSNDPFFLREEGDPLVDHLWNAFRGPAQAMLGSFLKVPRSSLRIRLQSDPNELPFIFGISGVEDRYLPLMGLKFQFHIDEDFNRYLIPEGCKIDSLVGFTSVGGIYKTIRLFLIVDEVSLGSIGGKDP